MSTTSTELLLPLGDSSAPGELTTRRWHHLMTVAGIEPASAQRLALAFPSLAAVYAADEEQLVRIVGPVVASRMRWFLDAPLDTGLSMRAVVRAKAA
jgi:Helix-hairpin-helix domain